MDTASVLRICSILLLERVSEMSLWKVRIPPRSPRILQLVSVVLLATIAAAAQDRPPAVPLITHTPYFSIWSMSDRLTDSNTKHWTGSEQPITGLIRIDGKIYRFIGSDPEDLPAMSQVSLEVTPLHTIYSFEAAGLHLRLTFFTPALPNDLEILTRPVTYLTWTLSSTDGRPHSAAVLIDVSPMIAVNSADQEVTWSRAKVPPLNVLSVGSRDQQYLHRAGDNVRIDWGYFFLASPESQPASLVASRNSVRSFVASGNLPEADDLEMPLQPRNNAAHLAIAIPDQVRTDQSIRRHVLLAYNEVYSIEYLGRKLRPYWQHNHQDPGAMLAQAEAQYPSLEERGAAFDQALTSDLQRIGGKPYAQLATLAYRQTVAAHGFAADVDGSLLMFPKENFSNGCISTVDVIYPAAPFSLLFNPSLLEAQLKPILEYAALQRWKFPFAPHDLGTYPLADGQVYGGGEQTEDDQMPVEESGNLLILMDALSQADPNSHLAEKYWQQLSVWAEYLRAKGLDPEKQLSTDDFAGHLAHNTNLSIKAIEGIAAYAQLANRLGKSDISKQYMATAKEMAARWQVMALDGDHYKLAFDKAGTWSQKYNLVWDRILNLGLFPSSVSPVEIAFYLHHLNRFGLPLDHRADYTKLDWEIWTATLADNPDDFNRFLVPIGRWINESPTRVPLTDWYDTKTGEQQGFQARSVVGGVFIKMLADKELAGKWRKSAAPQ